jgi:hypothetical protein
MQQSELLTSLGYKDSAHFLTRGDLGDASDYAHILRRSFEECGLRGAYALRDHKRGENRSLVPVVYVCKADGDDDADRVHRLVWNQNIVPFVLVLTPQKLRLYSGFKYASRQQANSLAARGILQAAIDFNEIMSALKAFKAESIDNGTLWREWGSYVTPQARVDWQLLSNLESLDEGLQRGGLSKGDSHALIGKYVYLRYLRDRGILSDRKLDEWEIDQRHIFSRDATLTAFQELLGQLEEWLNGAVFPLSASSIRKIGQQRLRHVAGTFSGDLPDGQLHLDFDAYDFSFIPIETLSVIYEQFLHAPDPKTGESLGRKRGAYYTPVPLVNFMLDEMDRHHPLSPGMRVLDPTCGSGAFLVQCYRKTIEQAIRNNPSAKPRPTELRDLLTRHIFGVDSDPDACQVAELSLILTLLDYVDPPDLSTTNFKLPALRNRNIWCCDAFDDESEWLLSNRDQGFDWIVGNPPWKDIKSTNRERQDESAFQWMQQNKRRRPTGGNQMAEAFAWRATEWIADDGLIGLLLPAMTLFKYESRPFRAEFFNRVALHCVANFANLAEVLFAGRSRVPAAAFFYSPLDTDSPDIHQRRPVLVYSPLVANQEANRPNRTGRRLDTWNIVINASEMREIPYRDTQLGDLLPWKIASWGSSWDSRLLHSVSKRFRTLDDLALDGVIAISQGLELRYAHAEGKKVEHHPELADKLRLNVTPLRKRKHVLQFPKECLEAIQPDQTYVRCGRFDLPYSVCKPPHIIVGAARNFAVYCDKFLIVPPRQIGISGSRKMASFLKALALYLNSDFVQYHQFFNSPQFGVQRERSTLKALRTIPVPILDSRDPELEQWCELYNRLLRASESRDADAEEENLFTRKTSHDTVCTLLVELNGLVNDSLGLSKRDRALVHDFVHIRSALNDGKIGEAAVRSPSKQETKSYAATLRSELDGFLGKGSPEKHLVTIVYDDQSGMISIDLVRNPKESRKIEVLQADSPTAREFQVVRDRLREQHSQWVYFDRNLRIYEGSRVYLFKPMQRVHWTRSQAFIDAGEIIAETLAPTEA